MTKETPSPPTVQINYGFPLNSLKNNKAAFKIDCMVEVTIGKHDNIHNLTLIARRQRIKVR